MNIKILVKFPINDDVDVTFYNVMNYLYLNDCRLLSIYNQSQRLEDFIFYDYLVLEVVYYYDPIIFLGY